MDTENFKRDLDELFRLFNLLMEKQSDTLNELPGVNKMMFQQFRMFFSNYETMKDQIASQLEGQFGEPVHEMVKTLISQLKEELGDDVLLYQTPEEDMPVHLKEKPHYTQSVEQEIEEIDRKLKNPNLSPKEIDDLLDRRSELTQ